MQVYKKVRLTKSQINTIKKTVKQFDENAQIILYGSRADLNKKGGDIDLLIISQKINLEELLRIKAKLFKHLGDRKIDIIIVKNPKDNIFAQIAYEKGVKL